MEAFLLVHLSEAEPFAFQQPLIVQVKQKWPEVAVLDLDNRSSGMVQGYAQELLRQAAKAAVLLQVQSPAADVGSLTGLLEELFQDNADRLILLLGRHQRLERMFQARPYLLFKQVAQPHAALKELESFFEA